VSLEAQVALAVPVTLAHLILQAHTVVPELLAVSEAEGPVMDVLVQEERKPRGLESELEVPEAAQQVVTQVVGVMMRVMMVTASLAMTT
jgi:hypothetical protein